MSVNKRRGGVTGWVAKEIKQLLPDHWDAEQDHYETHHVIASRSGPMAGQGYISENVARITLHHNYSGSGPDAFGKADTWPHLKVDMSFPAGTEADLTGLAIKMAAVIDEFMDKSKGRSD
jgi:hypothetical protein